MIRLKIFLAAVLTINCLAFSPFELKDKGLVHYQEFSHGEDKYILLVKNEKGQSHLNLYSMSGRLLVHHKRSSVGHGFINARLKTMAETGSLYLISFWKKGAHGKSALVFNLAKKKDKLIKTINSYLAMDYSEDLDSFTITYDKYLKDKSLAPVKQKTIFKSKGQVIESKL